VMKLAFLILDFISLFSLKSRAMMTSRYLNLILNGILLLLLLRIRTDGILSEFLVSRRVVGKYIALVVDLVEELPTCI